MGDFWRIANCKPAVALLISRIAEVVDNTMGYALIKPVSPITRKRIVDMALDGLTTEEIAKRVGRSPKTVASVLAAELDVSQRFFAKATVMSGVVLNRWLNDAAKACRRECYEEQDIG